MKKIFLALSLAFGLFLFSGMKSPFCHGNIRYANSQVAETEDEADSEEEQEDSSLAGYLLTGTGLVAVGGSGAVIVAINNDRRKKNENKPVKEYKIEE